MNGAEYIVEFLNRAEVSYCFGYPGGAVLTLYDALDGAKFEHILTGHEQGAIHAAEGYARATGNAGVVFATSGPGATNLVTGLANAFLDSTPIFAITGQVASPFIGRDSFQEADMQGITIPITKYNRLVRKVESLPSALELAWRVAQEDRPGPVLLDITKDVFAAEVPEKLWRWYRPAKKPSCDISGSARRAAELINQSKRPLILAGGGVTACKESGGLLHKLMREYQLPVVTTIMGKGAIPEDQPDFLGTVGMHGLPGANIALSDCDLLVAVGTRFSDRVIGDPDAYGTRRKIIHVDIDSAELNKNVIADLCIQSDALTFLQAVSGFLTGSHAEWMETCLERKELHPMTYPEVKYLLPQYVVQAVSERLDANTPVITDVGQHQMFAAQYAKLKQPRKFITSGGLGTMGFGLPASIGAALANPEKPAVLFVGDGGLQMTIQELATIKKHNLPVKIFVMDNACLGMVRQWQELFYDKFYSQSILNDNPDFLKIAQGYGIDGIELFSKEEFDQALEDILTSKKPLLVHCHISPEENVFPMVPPGKNPVDMLNKEGKRIMQEGG